MNQVFHIARVNVCAHAERTKSCLVRTKCESTAGAAHLWCRLKFLDKVRQTSLNESIIEKGKVSSSKSGNLPKNDSISIFYEYLSCGSLKIKMLKALLFETAHLENALCDWVDISALTHPDQLLATLLFFDLNIGLSEKLKIV